MKSRISGSEASPTEVSEKKPRKVVIGDLVVVQPDADNPVGPTVAGEVIAFVHRRDTARAVGCCLLIIPAAALPKVNRKGLVVRLDRNGDLKALRTYTHSQFHEPPELVCVFAADAHRQDPTFLPYYSVNQTLVDVVSGRQLSDGSISAGDRFNQGSLIALAD